VAISLPKVACCLIVKGTVDEASHLLRCLRSLEGHVDAFFIDVNHKDGVKPAPEILEIAKRYDKQTRVVRWTGSFVQARQSNFDRVPREYEFCLWVDSDDTVENPEKIHEVLAIAPKYVDGLYIKYDYDHDEYGNVTVTHWPARIVRNNSSFHWKSSFGDDKFSVHETLEPRRRVGKVMNEEFWVTHHADNDRKDASLVRNIELLEKMLERMTDIPDPRVLFYLGTHYWDAQRFEESKKLLENYLALSGWPEERAQAWVFIGKYHLLKNEPGKARGAFLHAMAENPNDPAPYVDLGELEYYEALYDKSIYWLDMAVAKKVPHTTLVRTPMETTYRAYMLLAQSHANLGGKSLDDAHKWVEKALKLRPLDPDTQAARELVDELIRTRELTQSVKALTRSYEKSEETAKIPDFIRSLPSEMQDNPLVQGIWRRYAEPVKWPKKSIAMFVGNGALGIFGPWSLKKGTGGSEEAVIRLSRQLVKEGWKVVVYGTPGDGAGTYDGVEWKQYWEMNLKDTFDVFVAWRSPWFFDAEIKARKKYLWLHDVMDAEEFIPERLANIDKVIVLSKYHRSVYPMIPDDKIFLSANGIDPEDFAKLDGKLERDPHRLIYTSSHVRGLNYLYDIWPEVLKAVPDAKLDIYYGWGSYDSVHHDNPERMAWKQKMIDRANSLKGVTDHGKIGQGQINEELFKSGIWAYPCPFPEIYCIAAVKAQAAGTVPVSSNYAALDETVQFGVKVPMQNFDEKEEAKFKDQLIDLMLHPDKQEAIRPKMTEWARTQSWAKVAKEWTDEFA
jgi:glycosyltransferase involved in cell wall biosynthesis